MRTGSPAFGGPEYVKATQASGQLARRYGLPFRSSNVTSANSVDAQAAYESQMSLWAALTGGAHLVYHAAGWLEGGLTASFEKLIIDAEMLQMMAATVQPIATDDDSLAVSAIAEVGHGGHFFGAEHTMARYERAFYRPLVTEGRNYESWRDAGAPDTAQRAYAIWQQLLAEYEQPPLDPDVEEQLREFVDRRRIELAE
jgi:trimethylamine--corrinoid protein Co-methyltransferase